MDDHAKRSDGVEADVIGSVYEIEEERRLHSDQTKL